MDRFIIIAIAMLVAWPLKQPLAACFLMAGYEVGLAAGKAQKEQQHEADADEATGQH